MALVCRGDGGAFDELHRRYAGSAHGYACRLVRDSQRAHDVVQEAFVSVWRGRASYRPERGAVGTWVMSMVHHRAVDHLRREARAAPLLRDPERVVEAGSGGCLAKRMVSQELAHDLRAHVKSLPERQRQVLTLAFFGGLSHAEIAAELKLPLGTAKGAIRCGLQRLRKQMT